MFKETETNENERGKRDSENEIDTDEAEETNNRIQRRRTDKDGIQDRDTVQLQTE